MIRNRVPLVAGVALGVMGAAVAAHGAGRQASPADAAIERQVNDTLSDEDELRGIRATVRDGAVTLRGEAPSVGARTEAARVATGVAGVRSVVDEVTIARVDDDRVTATRVAEQVRTYPLFTIFDHADIGVNRGVVTLFGKVTERIKATELARRASRVLGVQEVRNQIETLPASTSDDGLRAELADRIYRHPFLEQYGRMRHPPIHIIVERGHVTLTGAVSSPNDRQVAGSVANGTFGVLSVENRLMVAGR